MAYPVTYDRPRTLDEAVRAALEPGSIALAGGAMTFTGVLLPYKRVVDLQNIAELKTITSGTNHVQLGSAASLQAVFNTPGLPPALKRALTRSLNPNLRAGTSVGESLITPQPPREWLAALIAVGADITHRPGAESRQEPLEDFLHGLWQSSEPYRGVVVSLDVPLPGERSALGADFVARTPADHPIVNAAVCVNLGDDGLVSAAMAALGGASAAPVIGLELPNLVGTRLNEDTIEHVVKPIPSLVDPLADYKGSADYRREMVRVCVRRALLDCLGQLGSQ
jgi:aerobic carbon-monoxide dehydrogenase medium subunit